MNTSISIPDNPKPERNWPLLIIVLIIILLIAGCKGSQHLAVTERVTHDTCYISNIQYDSIYVFQGKEKDYRKGTPSSLTSNPTPDTLLIKEVSTEYRYRMLRDTIKVVKNDSIPYEVKVIETRTERYTPWYARSLAFIGFLALVWFAIRVFIKIKFNR